MKNKFKLAVLLFFGISSFGRGQIIPDSIYPPADIVIPDLNDWSKTHYPERIAEFKKKPLETDDIVFIGCSITEMGGDWGIRFNSPIVKNRGIAGDVTSGVLARLGEIYYFKPSAVFILIGVNDLFANKSVDFVAGNIKKIVQNIYHYTPHTKIYVQTILPTSHDYLVDKIKETNNLLRHSISSDHYTLIDLHEIFANDTDLMKTEYTTDGVHLTGEGYKIWVNKVKNLIPPTTTVNLLKNADLQADFANWTVSGTPNMFKMADWSPADPVVKSFGNNYWDWTYKIDGSITQTVSNLQDGKYIFSCQFAGATPGTKSHSALIAKNGDNIIEKKDFIMPSNWTKFEMPFSVTGGKCSVGFTIKDTLKSEFWWAASDFRLYFISPIPTKVLNDTAPADFTSITNPFSNETTLCFRFPFTEKSVKLEILDLNGRLVKSYTESNVEADRLYRYKFSADGYDGQIFIARLVTSNKVLTLKIIKRIS